MKLLLTAALMAVPAFSQTATAHASVKDALVQHWRTTGDFTLSVARMMPANQYAFRPTPGALSFGQLMIEIAAGDLGACFQASALPQFDIPERISQVLVEPEKDVDKDSAIQFLSATFKYCNDAVASMTPAKLEAVVGTSRTKMTGFEWLWSDFTRTAHHRGQAVVYLLVKGISPPAFTF